MYSRYVDTCKADLLRVVREMNPSDGCPDYLDALNYKKGTQGYQDFC